MPKSCGGGSSSVMCLVICSLVKSPLKPMENRTSLIDFYTLFAIYLTSNFGARRHQPWR